MGVRLCVGMEVCVCGVCVYACVFVYACVCLCVFAHAQLPEKTFGIFLAQLQQALSDAKGKSKQVEKVLEKLMALSHSSS